MAIELGSITNADTLINGVDVAGRIMELDLSEFGYEEVEHKSLGMIGVLALPSRAVKELKKTIKWEYLDPDLKRQLLSPTKTHRLQLHQYVDVSDADGLSLEKSHTLVYHLGFRTLNTKQGTSKLGENVEMEQEISIVSLVMKVYGEEIPILEYDVFSNIHKVNGEDVWPT